MLLRFLLIGLGLVLSACAADVPASAPSNVSANVLAAAAPNVAATPANAAPAQPATSSNWVEPTSNEIRFSDVGNTMFGEWRADVVTSPSVNFHP